MSAQNQVPKLYKSVIEDVINNVREAFMDEGVDESVLSELKNIWQSKLTASKVMESDMGPAVTANDPLMSGPYIALQQQQQQHNAGRVQGYQEKQQHQTITRTPAVPVSSVPMFTTMTNPGAELSDAASMAYSSILQSQQQQQHPGQSSAKGAASAASSGAAGGQASRAQLVAAAAAAQPQYLFASPGSVGPVIIPHSQAVRLQQQQQQLQRQQGRGGHSSGMRGSVPQVDGALDDRPVIDNDNDYECPAVDPNLSLLPLRDSKSPFCEKESRQLFPKDSNQTSPSRFSSLIRPDLTITTSVDSATHQSPMSSTPLLSDSANFQSPISTESDDHSLNDTAEEIRSPSAFPIALSDTRAASTTAQSSLANQFSSSSSPAELRLSDGKSLRGKIIEKSAGTKSTEGQIEGLGKTSGKKCSPAANERPKKGDKIEIVFQVDGNHSSSDDDDDDDDDDGDANGDDSSDRDPDDEDIPGVEDEPLNSEDDVSDNDPEELFDTENVVVCQYEKISRVRNKWRFYLKDGIMNIQGRDYVFLKASGEAEW